MLFFKKNKTPADCSIDSLSFLSDEAKQAFKLLEIYRTSELVDKKADNLYLDLCVESGGVADRVILYEMRAAVYFSQTVKPDEKKLRWWYWKDSNTGHEDSEE